MILQVVTETAGIRAPGPGSPNKLDSVGQLKGQVLNEIQKKRNVFSVSTLGRAERSSDPHTKCSVLKQNIKQKAEVIHS